MFSAGLFRIHSILHRRYADSYEDYNQKMYASQQMYVNPVNPMAAQMQQPASAQAAAGGADSVSSGPASNSKGAPAASQGATTSAPMGKGVMQVMARFICLVFRFPRCSFSGNDAPLGPAYVCRDRPIIRHLRHI